MNKKYLFKGKTLYNNKWIYGYLLPKRERDGKLTLFILDIETSKFCKVKKETIEKFTGATDTNNQKIFDGDIVYTGGVYDKGIHFIKFNPEYNAFCLHRYINDAKPECTCTLNEYISFNQHIAVIGNIHDNKNILEENRNYANYN